MQSVASTIEGTQRVLEKLSGSPTMLARPIADRVRRVSTGGISLSYLLRGSFPGLPSSVNSPSALNIAWMTSSQVRSPSASLPVSSLTHTRSVYMTIGSPALAAYSLALTTLNSRFVYARASRIPHESKTAVARALISLQQIPLELTKDERLLAFIPVGDQWRREIIDRLDRRSTRSIAMASSIAWVIIAFLFTLIDSFVSLDSPDGASEGLSVGILWLWLLCIVIGWLWIPTFTYDELKSALYHANEKAADKAAKKLRQQASMAYNATRVQIRNRLPGRAPNSPIVDPVSQVPEENEKVKEESFQGFGIRAGQKNDQKTNPFINPAHHRSTVSFQVPSESQQDHDRLSVGANPSANQSVTSVPHTVGYSSHPNMDRLLIPLDRYDPLHRDELRLAPIFNYARVFRYKALVDDVFRALDEHAREKEEVSLSRSRLISEIVPLILNRGSGLSLRPLSLGLRRRLCSLPGRSPRCSGRRFLPLFSSVEQPLQPRSSKFSPPQLVWVAVHCLTPSME